MRIVLQIIRNFESQEVPSVIISCDSDKYIFNLPEIFQRFIRDHNQKFTQGSKIFFTGLTPEHMSGFFGFGLTLFEQKLASGACVFGPPGITSFFHRIRFIMGIKYMPYSFSDFSDAGQTTLGVTMEYLEKLVQHKDFKDIYHNWQTISHEIRKGNEKSFSDAAKFLQKSPERFSDGNLEVFPVTMNALDGPRVSYVIKTKEIPGSMIKEKIEELKIPKKEIRNLIANKSLMVGDRLVKLEEVQREGEPSQCIGIIDCPDELSLSSLLSNSLSSSLNLLRPDSPGYGKSHKTKLIVHLAPAGVLSKDDYAKWISQLAPDTEHFFIHESVVPLLSKVLGKQRLPENLRHYTYANSLAKHFPEIFPSIPRPLNTQACIVSQEDQKNIGKLLESLRFVHLDQFLHEFVIVPVKKQGYSLRGDLDSKEAVSIDKFPAFPSLLTYAKEKLPLKLQQGGLGSHFSQAGDIDPEIIVLGTGSMMPSQYRNVSAIYLKFPEHCDDFGVLLDCGEGTYMQFLNHFGLEKTEALLMKLRVIFITHMHLDHHMGFLYILKKREKIFQKHPNVPKTPLFFIIPENVYSFVSHLRDINGLQFKLVTFPKLSIKAPALVEPPSQSTEEAKEETPVEPGLTERKPEAHLQKIYSYDEEMEMKLEFEEIDIKKKLEEIQPVVSKNKEELESLLFSQGITLFEAVKVVHCPQAHGIVIGHRVGWKIVYSGDCRPSLLLQRRGQHATVLIHEATFEDEMIEDAKSKNHTTMGEAVLVAKKMGSKSLIMTHFSQRYSPSAKEVPEIKLHLSKEDYEFFEKNTLMAVDHLHVKLSQLLQWTDFSKAFNAHQKYSRKL